MAVSEEDPFAGDCLERKDFAEALTSLVHAVDGGGVLTIEGEWGSGKTTFLRMWRETLVMEGFRTIYFSAWETDHSDAPLVSLLGEFESQIMTEGEGSGWKTRLYSAGEQLLKRGLPLAARAAAGGIISTDTTTENSLSESTVSLTQKCVNQYSQEKAAIVSFREALESLSNQSDKPIVVLVDELDRCRPAYAVEMLERIKHLFGVNGVVFLLAIDREQLGHSIRSIYGSGMNPDGYLRRFIDLPCKLPDPDVKAFTRNIIVRFDLHSEILLKSDYEFRSGHAGETESVLNIYFCAYKPALRIMEQIVGELAVVFATTKVNQGIVPIATSTLLFLRYLDRSLYHRFLSRKITAGTLISELRRDETFAGILDGRHGQLIEIWLRAITYTGDSTSYDDLEEILKGDPDNERTKQMVDRLKDITSHLDYDTLEYLRKKLSFSEALIVRDDEEK